MSAASAARPLIGAVKHVELLDETEVAQVRAAVHAQRSEWTMRDAALPFYTLGAASYLDARGGRFAEYQEQARRTNPILVEHFGWLLERVRAAVSAHVNAGACYDERLARPGFHVFLFDPAFRYAVASAHYDLQYTLLDWSGIGAPDASSQLSVTLTIALPASGGGLLVWNMSRLALDRMSSDERRTYAVVNRIATLVPYTPGHLVIHSGHQLHRIAPVEDPRPGDERITMQAHTLRVDGKWVIYW